MCFVLQTSIFYRRQWIIINGAENDNVDGLTYNADDVKEGNILLFTAGENECDKAVVLTLDNIMSAISYINAHCNCTEDDRVLAQIELSKIFGCYTALYGR